MKKILFLSLVLGLAISVRISHEGELQKVIPILGPPEKVDVSKANKEIDAYIRKQIPELSSANLVAASQQIVSGTNYQNTYKKDGKTWIVTVWDRSWLKKREITNVEKIEEKKNSEGKTVQVKTNVQKNETFKQAIEALF